MAEHAPSKAHAAMNPAALSIPDTARVLSRAGGGGVSVDMLRTDIDAGAPTNADGTINLVHYAAWLVKEAARGD